MLGREGGGGGLKGSGTVPMDLGGVVLWVWRSWLLVECFWLACFIFCSLVPMGVYFSPW